MKLSELVGMLRKGERVVFEHAEDDTVVVAFGAEVGERRVSKATKIGRVAIGQAVDPEHHVEAVLHKAVSFVRSATSAEEG